MDNDRVKGLLALIERSPDQGEGWRNVSGTCWPLIVNMPDDLVQIDHDNRRIRMTKEGHAVLRYR